MKNQFLKIVTVIALGFFHLQLIGQDDLLDGLEEDETVYTFATFKGSRIINLHTNESVGKNNLEFRISHRFGEIGGGAYELFGLDQSTIRLGFEYGLTDWLTIGVGRSTYEKTVDGFTKFRILRQSKGISNMPVSVSYFSSFTANGLKWLDPSRDNLFSSRLAYVNQLIITRKFTKSFSMLLSPTIVHKNLVQTKDDQNTTFAIGVGGRIKITKRMSLTSEYIYRIPPAVRTSSYSDYKDSFSVGFELETGGHVFQLQFSNSLPMIEKAFITETTGSWKDFGIHFGFNISREFTLIKH